MSRTAAFAVAAWIIAAASALGDSTPVAAQPIPTLRLKPPSAQLADGFTFITSVRELADGRVLVTDEKENRLAVVDFSRQKVDGIGRIGGGPAEYRQVGRLWPLGGDSTLMADPFSRRWLVLDGSRIVATRAPSAGAGESGPLLGADKDGSVVLAVHSLTAAGKLTGLRDSMFVLRVDRRRAADTIARVPSEFANYDRTKPPPTLQLGGAGTQRVYRVAIGAGLDQLIMFNDGWVAIARMHPYRVDWCAPTGTCTTGSAIPEPQVRIGDTEKRAYLRAAARSSRWPANVSLSAVTGWPEYFPPFAAKTSRIDASPLLTLPDGRLLIERVPTGSSVGLTYDIVDRRGVRVAQLQLPPDQQIVGFGPRSIYVVITDDDDLQHLERHPWP